MYLLLKPRKAGAHLPPPIFPLGLGPPVGATPPVGAELVLVSFLGPESLSLGWRKAWRENTVPASRSRFLWELWGQGEHQHLQTSPSRCFRRHIPGTPTRSRQDGLLSLCLSDSLSRASPAQAPFSLLESLSVPCSFPTPRLHGWSLPPP